MSTPHDVHFDDTLAATRGRSHYYFSFATWPIGVGTSRTAPSRCTDPPYIPFATGGGSCARGSAAGGGTHVSSGGGSTPPNAAVGARWRSMHVRFVTSILSLITSLKVSFASTRISNSGRKPRIKH